GSAQSQAGVLAQIVRALGPTAAGQVGGAADDDEAERRRQPHRDHIGGDELAHPDAGVESFGGEIDPLLAGGALHPALWVGLAERRDQWLQQDRHDRARHREAQSSGRPLAEVTRDRAGGDELLEGGLGARQEFLASLGQADAARGADEQRRADARFERPDRLTDRRWRHPELTGRTAEIAVLGDAEERPDAVERALTDCEVLLHSLSILSRIVARGKR